MNDNTPNPEITEETAWDNLTDQELIDKLESPTPIREKPDPAAVEKYIKVKKTLIEAYNQAPVHPDVKIKYGIITKEQQEQITELFEDHVHSEDPDKDLPTLAKALVMHDSKKPAGEPPEISKEERAAILEYYKNGATGTKPANADRFTMYTTSWSNVNINGGKPMQVRNRLKDIVQSEWEKGPAAEWIEEGRKLSEKIGNIRDDIIDEAIKSFLGLSLMEIAKIEGSISLEVTLFYTEIISCVSSLFEKELDEIETLQAVKEAAALQTQSLKLNVPQEESNKYGLIDDQLGKYILTHAPQILEAGKIIRDGNIEFRYFYEAPLSKKDPSKGAIRFLTEKMLEPDIDIPVMEAIGNLFYELKREGNEPPFIITAAQVARHMKGYIDASIDINPELVESVEQSIERISGNHFLMSHEDELKLGYIKAESQHAQDIVRGSLLHADKLFSYNSKGRPLKSWRIFYHPELYGYNVDKGQLKFTAFKNLKIPGRSGDPKFEQLVKEYLLKQINPIAKGKRNPLILIDTIYADSGAGSPEYRIEASGKTYKDEAARKNAVKHLAQRDRKAITRMLEYWKTQPNSGILSFEWVKSKDKKSFKGVRIITE